MGIPELLLSRYRDSPNLEEDSSFLESGEKVLALTIKQRIQSALRTTQRDGDQTQITQIIYRCIMNSHTYCAKWM